MVGTGVCVCDSVRAFTFPVLIHRFCGHLTGSSGASAGKEGLTRGYR
jgi:hypothetical protein